MTRPQKEPESRSSMREMAGVLLAGGLGRRMGGVDKALVSLGGRALAARAVSRLSPQVGTLILNANGDPARFAHLGLPVVADETTDFAGPLAGVLAALHWFAREKPEVRAVLSASVDVPFLPGDLASRLHQALHADSSALVAAAQSRGQRHHVIALWRMEAAAEIEAALAQGLRKAETVVDRLRAVAVPFTDLEINGQAIDPFFNINTPEDLALAETMLAETSDSESGGSPFVIGVAGWKNSGKTTLVTKLVTEIARRGYRVATIKHSHHDIEQETEGTDSARHRSAGATRVALVSPQRWTVIHDASPLAWRKQPDPPLATIVAALAPADIIIVEGMKRATIPKIEVRRTGQSEGPPLAAADPLVIAVATDTPETVSHVPSFALDDAPGLADLIIAMAMREDPPQTA